MTVTSVFLLAILDAALHTFIRAVYSEKTSMYRGCANLLSFLKSPTKMTKIDSLILFLSGASNNLSLGLMLALLYEFIGKNHPDVIPSPGLNEHNRCHM